jgi:hypothetical protein
MGCWTFNLYSVEIRGEYKMIIHKADYKRKFDRYIGFGQYEKIPSVTCDKKHPWNNRTYHITRDWKNVTCKKCLKHRELK